MTADQYFKEHGITQSSIEKFGLVFNKEKIIFPIKDGEGNILFHKYRHLANDADHKFSYEEGSSATLFNTAALKESNYIFLCEGEPDCIRLDQEGIAAVTNTSGAGTFKEEWIDQLKGKKIYVIYDNDKAGKEGALKVQELIPTAIIITLPGEIKDICHYFQTYSKADFRKMVDEQVKTNTITYQELCNTIDKWLLLPDKNVIRILLATLVSHFFTTDPLWMFFVAPPSGSKTEIISTAGTLPFVKMLSDLTAQTLVSGMQAKKDPSLLLQLHDNVLVMKDFTTVLTMRREDRQVVLSQLREIYDGKYSKAFGTGKVVEWEGRLTLIAGVTPIIDTHHAVFQVMGERFVMYRVPQADDRKVAKKALKNYGSEKQMREELRNAMQKYFLSLEIPHVSEIELPEDIVHALANLASFIVKARSALVRDYRNELTYIPETEAPSRLAKQLGTLIKALAVLDKRKKVSWSDYYMTLRVAIDIIPANRTKHLIALCDPTISMYSTSQVAQLTDYSKSGAENILEDLTALKIVRVIRQGSGHVNQWGISPETKTYFAEILPGESEELWDVFLKDSSYAPLLNFMLKNSQPLSEEEEKEDAWTTVNELF
jgi:5S rRNA maturation endonuclease (ribonuclease M5)